MADCFFHPEHETKLTCANCGRNICPDCMNVTSVGIRCPLCVKSMSAVTTPLPGLQTITRPTDRTMRRFAAGLVLTLLGNLLMAPFVLLPALAAAVATALWRRLANWPQLVGGFVYFIIAWLVIVPQLLNIGQGKIISLQQDPPEMTISLFLLAVTLLLIPFLWKPARYCSQQLILQGRGFAAGLTLAASLSATGISVITALFIIVLSF